MNFMDYQPIEDFLPRTKGSVYRLSRMAATRALELADGRKPLVEASLTSKLTSIALEEIKQGKIELKGANSVPPEPKAKKSDKAKTEKEAEE